MPERPSALDSVRVAGRHGVAGEAGVVLEEVRCAGLYQLAAWPESIAAAGAVVASAAGVATAPGPGRLARGQTGLVLRVEPLKWWLVSETPIAIERAALPAEIGSWLDLSDSRCRLRIGGSHADTLLNHFLPIDLRAASFTADAVASTAMHHVGVTLWRGDGDFNLALPRSFAASLWEMLHQSACQYGLVVR